MGVTFIAPQGTYTAPAKLVSKSITENGTYDPADDNANGYSSVKVEVEGGGGSSDFTTAEVTVINIGVNHIAGAFIVIGPEYELEGSIGDGFGSNTLTAILYKGKGYYRIDGTVLSTSGDITYNEDLELYEITGDCSISFYKTK